LVQIVTVSCYMFGMQPISFYKITTDPHLYSSVVQRT
jgi:hypothetical protein